VEAVVEAGDRISSPGLADGEVEREPPLRSPTRPSTHGPHRWNYSAWGYGRGLLGVNRSACRT